MSEHFLDHYIIFDIAALENNGEDKIVEIGAIKTNEVLETIDSFNQKIELSKHLTDILPDFENWIKKDKADYKFMYSWGKNQRDKIIGEAKEKNYCGNIYDLLLYFSSLQHVFKNMKDNKLHTIKNAMKELGIEYKENNCLMNNIHNVVNIFCEIYGKWIHPGYPLFPTPDEKIFTGEKYWLKN